MEISTEMLMTARATRTSAIAAAALLAAALPVRAQETAAAPAAADDGWKDTAEFAFVATSGNSESSTLGFSNKLWREWGVSRFETNAKAVRAESRTEPRFAVGTPTDFDVEEPDTQLSAENYFLDVRYDRKITQRTLWLGGVEWARD